MDQPGKVANPARGQLNRENEFSPLRIGNTGIIIAQVAGELPIQVRPWMDLHHIFNPFLARKKLRRSASSGIIPLIFLCFPPIEELIIIICTYVYVLLVITYSRVWINRVRLPILPVVS